MIKLPVTLAVSVYDHVRDLTEGKIPIEGIDLIPLELPVEEIFHRFIAYREWDVSELSLAKYVAMRAAGTADFTAIPVFPSRMFRMSSGYVLQESKLREPRDLAGKRIGVPEWAQTAAVYTRGWLSETVGLDLADINWVQAGVNEPGRKEKVTILMPDGVECISRPDSSLTELLRNGEIDAMFTAHPPRPIEDGTAEFRSMIGNTREVEERYFRETGIFPIMHVIAIRDELMERHPGVAQNLYKGFLAARSASLERLRELTASRFPLPWAASYASAAEDLFGDLFPYGVDNNRTTLEAFVRFAHNQGLTEHPLLIDDLFAPSVRSSFRV